MEIALWLKAERPMRCGNGETAFGKMSLDRHGKPLLRSCIEPCRWFIEQPQDSLDEAETREREPPALPGREELRWIIRKSVQIETR